MHNHPPNHLLIVRAKNVSLENRTPLMDHKKGECIFINPMSILRMRIKGQKCHGQNCSLKRSLKATCHLLIGYLGYYRILRFEEENSEWDSKGSVFGEYYLYRKKARWYGILNFSLHYWDSYIHRSLGGFGPTLEDVVALIWLHMFREGRLLNSLKILMRLPLMRWTRRYWRYWTKSF